MSALFQPISFKSVTLKNRIAVSPMCQYSAHDGIANDWHLIHLAGLARGGSGLVVVEATAVSPEGRITPNCLGLWADEQAQVLSKSVQAIKAAGAVPGIQIGHAGRKASANRPWEGDDHITPDDPRAWETLSASAIAFGANLPRVPKAMTVADIARVQADFVSAAKRALAAGFEVLMLHFAHGYLAQNFLSDLSNKRTDDYGGSFDNRSRFLIETFQAVRQVWPDHLPLCVRLGVIEFNGNDQEDVENAIHLLQRLKAAGLDFADISMGFSSPTSQIPWAPGFMAPIAAEIRNRVDIPVATSWMITDAQHAETLVQQNSLDLVMLGRALLSDPHWPYHAAKTLGVKDPSWVLPAPYAHWLERYGA